MMRRAVPGGLLMQAMRGFSTTPINCSPQQQHPVRMSTSSSSSSVPAVSTSQVTTMKEWNSKMNGFSHETHRSGLTQHQRRYFSNSMMNLARGAGHSSKKSGGIADSLQNQFNIFAGGGQSQSSGSAADSLTPHVRQHLVRVYNLLGVGVATAACGSALMMLTPLGRAVPYYVPMVGGFVPLLWLMFAPPKNPALKVGLFLAFTLLEGMTLAPIIYATAAKGVLGSALVMTAAVFGGFSAAAYLAPRASLLAFQGPLIGLLMGMVAISLLNMIYPTAFAHSIVLYGGLALFSALVAVDTQAMIERARCGVGDHVQDALQMFLNVVNIFVRISAILRSMGE